MDTTKEYIAMCEAAEEIQEHFSDIDNRIGWPAYFYQYAGKGMMWEVYERIGFAYDADFANERTKHVWLPSQDQLQDLSSAFGIPGMLYEFNDFVLGPPKNRDNALRYSAMFKTVEQLWLGFIMEQNYEKHWNGSKWEKIQMDNNEIKKMKEDKVPSGWKEAVKRNESYRWKVYHTISQCTVCLSLIHGMTTLNNTDIHIPPTNCIERLCGITQKSKIEKAYHKQKERCRRLNEHDARDRMLEREMDKIQVGLSE